MGSFLSKEQLARLQDAEVAAFRSPVPTQMISNGEFMPEAQTPEQGMVEALIQQLGETYGRRLGMDRRRFLQTASGMALAFMAMNSVHGALFELEAQEATDPDVAAERAKRFAHQFVADAQVHFIKDQSPAGSQPHNMINVRRFAQAVLNKELQGRDVAVDDLKFQNFVKEVFLDSDTQLAILSGAPSDTAENWFLSNDQMRRARELVNAACGSRRMLSHAVMTPGQPGWLEEIDRAIAELQPDSWKGYTMGDPNGPSKYRWRADDEKLVYPAYERFVRSGIRNVCLHKGLLTPDAEMRMPGVTAHADVSDIGKAAKDWPQLNFIIYHCAYNVLLPSAKQSERFEADGTIPWVSDLAAIPATFDVNNVYAEIGSSFGISAVTQPRFCAGMLGTLIKGMGVEKVFWGTDAVWYGSPQWQIEAFRRIEIPEDLQKKFGFAPLGPGDGEVKSAVLGLNLARHYRIDVPATQKAFAADKLTTLRQEYAAAGPERSNLAYGFIAERI
jgi:predicted TIM-barrel fold metal-dependent hydrolase